MILILGGRGQGKLSYALRTGEWTEQDVTDGAVCPLAEAFSRPVCNHFHLLVQRLRQAGLDPVSWTAEHIKEDITILCDEIGQGIVPVARQDRDWREDVGRTCCLLAEKACCVIRICCGIPQVLKEQRPIFVALIRHGITEGNRENRYIGLLDQPVCPEGIRALQKNRTAGLYPAAERIYSSPLTRCIQTAREIYPETPIEQNPELRECSFGAFEGKNYQELNGDPDYQRFIDTGGQTAFPGGEEPSAFRARSVGGFLKSLVSMQANGIRQGAIICHGGTIMSVMAYLFPEQGGFYDWHVSNGEGFYLRIDRDFHAELVRRIRRKSED